MKQNIDKTKGRPQLAFVRLEAGDGNCRAVVELARQLSVSRATALGYFTRVLLWAAAHAPDGNVSELSHDELASAAGYDGADSATFGRAFLWACTQAGVIAGWHSISRPLRQAAAQRAALNRWGGKQSGAAQADA